MLKFTIDKNDVKGIQGRRVMDSSAYHLSTLNVNFCLFKTVSIEG
ncbi:hypothetical protein CEXT_280631, partial [Caerostris extrusa]